MHNFQLMRRFLVMFHFSSFTRSVHYGAINSEDNLKCASTEVELENAAKQFVVKALRVVFVLFNLQFKTLKYCDLAVVQ